MLPTSRDEDIRRPSHGPYNRTAGLTLPEQQLHTPTWPNAAHESNCASRHLRGWAAGARVHASMPTFRLPSPLSPWRAAARHQPDSADNDPPRPSGPSRGPFTLGVRQKLEQVFVGVGEHALHLAHCARGAGRGGPGVVVVVVEGGGAGQQSRWEVEEPKSIL